MCFVISDKNGGYIYIKVFFSLHIIRIVSVYSRFVLIFRKPHNDYFITYEIITRIYMQAVNFIFFFININYSLEHYISCHNH